MAGQREIYNWLVLPATADRAAVEINMTLCIETFPCQHYVRWPTGTTSAMSSDEIASLFAERGLKCHHHFARSTATENEIKTWQDFQAQVAKADVARPWDILPSANGFMGVAIDIGKCRKSFPCKHYVLFTDAKSKTTLSGDTIANLYFERGLPVADHFKKYAGETGADIGP